MNNLNAVAGSTSNITWGSNSTATVGWYYCATHGWGCCGCISPGSIYPIHLSNYVQCLKCSQWYDPSNAANQHLCFGYTSTTTTTLSNWITGIGSNFKDVKEISTDSELTYEWSGTSFDMKLPQQFSDCFLKVGYKYSPLYPLIFSALENDEKTVSFHLVLDITDKAFEGDKVVLKSVTTTKIEDNLTLLQLTQRVRDYFKDK